MKTLVVHLLLILIIASSIGTGRRRQHRSGLCQAFSPVLAHRRRTTTTTTAPSSSSFVPSLITTLASSATTTTTSGAVVPPSFVDPTTARTTVSASTSSGGASTNNDDDEVNNHSLGLDPNGNLLLNDSTVLLNGLTSSIWHSSRPTTTPTSSDTTTTSSDSSSLFLHAQYPKELAEHESSLGNLVTCHRLLACSRLTRYWMGPKVGTGAKDVPFDTQFLLIDMSSEDDDDTKQGKQSEGPYALLLPLVDNGFRASLHYDGTSGGSNKNSIEVVCLAESGDVDVTTSGMRALYVAVGDDPYELLRRGFRQVADATGTFRTLEQKQLPPCIDDFGWCTWDAFYSKVTPDGVLDGIRELSQAGVPPKTIILDDGWQQVTPSPPDWNEDGQLQEEEEPQEETTPSTGSRIATYFGDMIGSVYDKYVKRAAYGSKRNRIWSALSRTVLKNGLWEYFDSDTDFNRQLSGFHPNYKFGGSDKEEEPMSLKSLVSELKNEHDVKNVLCWHALHGYWRGVSPELGTRVGLNVTNVIPKPSKNLLRLEPQLEWDPVSLFGVGLLSNEKELDKFYEHLHKPLLDAGVDGVKVDVQSGVSAAGGGVGGGPHLAKLYTNAMERSVSQRFIAKSDTDTGDDDEAASAAITTDAINCINCMCHSTENLYRYKSTSVARASDDFYPTRPESHTVHIVNVAYNSLFIGEICQPDWDMFHSKHETASLHAAARAVGGCPVYVSDQPGEHDAELLRKLVLPDGSVLRAKLPGRPTRDCLFVDVGADGHSALKIWNENAHGGVVGAFNVQGVAWNFKTHENEIVDHDPKSVMASVKPYDIESLRHSGHDGPFAAWRYQSSELEFLPRGDSAMEVSLDHRDYDISTIVPIQIDDNTNIMWAPIGLVNMMNSGGAVLDVGQLHSSSTTTTTEAQFTCRGPGQLVAFTNRRPSKVVLLPDNGTDGTTEELAFTHDADKCELSIMLPSEKPTTPGSSRQPHKIAVYWE